MSRSILIGERNISIIVLLSFHCCRSPHSSLIHSFVHSLIYWFTVVPYNQPVAAMDLLNRFLKNETFLDLPSPTIRFGDRKIERAKVAANPTVSSSSSSSSTNAEIGSNDSFVVGGGVALLAFVGGIIFTLLFTKFQNSRRKGGKYSRIPETR